MKEDVFTEENGELIIDEANSHILYKVSNHKGTDFPSAIGRFEEY